MAKTPTVTLRATLRKLFSPSHLQALARKTGAVIRQRKVNISALFWTLVLGFGVGRTRTIAGLRRSYEKNAGQTIEESSFFDRFTVGLVKMLKHAAAEALANNLGFGRALRGHLATFQDVIMTDSTVIRLHSLLEKAFPACRTNHTKAALKAHAILSVTGAGKQSIKVTAERKHDGPVFRVGKWVAGKLLLFDLGYFRYQLFSCITRNGGYFLTRLKGNCNPVIVALNKVHRGRAVPVVGRKLREVVGGLQRDILDVNVTVRFQRRRYAGKRHYASQELRVVGVRDQRSGDYHLYITNIPPQKLAAEDIQATYAARWMIELLFAEWKGRYRLADMPSSKKTVVEALLYAALITLAVSRRLLHALRSKLSAEQRQRLKPLRWAAVFESVAQDLLRIVCKPPREVRTLEYDIIRTILHEAPDPNASRPGLLQAVENGVHTYG
jgi:IS4 transposase